MFAGRADELNRLEKALIQTRHENPHHFLIHGDRGIGKSSLLFYLQSIARNQVAAYDGSRFNFLTIGLELEPSNTYTDLIRKIGSELKRALTTHGNARQLAKNTWDFLSNWEILGVKYSRPEGAAQEQIEDLTHALRQASLDLQESFEGILILIDEADKPPASANLGELLKLLTERLAKQSCFRIAIGLAGQSSVLGKLRKSHESSPRILELLTLEPLEPQERAWVIKRGVEQIKEKVDEIVRVDSSAEELICAMSDGFPHFLQQFAYSAFAADTDNHVTISDVLAGAFGENGALQQLGLKYFEELYFSQISSDRYREVLQIMATKSDGWVTKREIREKVEMSDYVLTNAIHTLSKRGIIVPKKGAQGVYRLPSKSFAAWIAAFAKAPSQASP